MAYADRQALYREIEAQRKSKVISLVNGERPRLETQIAVDAVAPLIALLDKIGPTSKLSLVLDTNGGSTSAAWRLINLIRSFGDFVEVIVPTKAMSAGTLMCLGADAIVMTKQAALGPIDPSLSQHPLAPKIEISPGRTATVPVSAEAVRGFLDELKKDVKDATALVTIWNHLSTQIHPIVLGEIFRLGGQIRAMAKRLIVNQVKDATIQDKIIQLLCSDSGSHDYTIDRRQAKEMGLTVEKASAELYAKLTDLVLSYADELETFQPFSPQSILGGKATADYKLVRGLIESTEGGCYAFVSEGKFHANPTGGFADQLIYEGWKKLP